MVNHGGPLGDTERENLPLTRPNMLTCLLQQKLYLCNETLTTLFFTENLQVTASALKQMWVFCLIAVLPSLTKHMVLNQRKVKSISTQSFWAD